MNIKYTEKEIDILVLGAGLAGLEAAYAAAKEGSSVAVLSKGESASPGVIGFNANVSEQDTDEVFFEDIYSGGWRINDKKLISALVKGSVKAVKDTEELGLVFDVDGDQKHLMKPLGCSFPRLVHDANLTGAKTMGLLNKYLKSAGVDVWDNMTAVKILSANESVCGVIAFNGKDETIRLISCKAVVLATGGGHFLKNSTYPQSHTGDGYAMAWDAGAQLRDMEFIQFEPCRAVYPKPLGISTTILRKGGKLTNSNGERFILNSYESEGAVPKDIMSRLIASELLAGRASEHGGVYLDLRELPEEEIVENHSMYFKRFMAVGIDLRKDIVEVAPAAHSFMGGVVIDENAATTVDGLFAAGEVTGGIHGANRIGGNAGTETYVFGTIAGKSASAYAAEHDYDGGVRELADSFFTPFDNSADNPVLGDELLNIREKVLSLMAGKMGPVREASSLISLIEDLNLIADNLENRRTGSVRELISLMELRNIVFVSKLSARAALMREETRGVHFRKDFPSIDDEKWLKNIFFSKKADLSVREVE